MFWFALEGAGWYVVFGCCNKKYSRSNKHEQNTRKKRAYSFGRDFGQDVRSMTKDVVASAPPPKSKRLSDLNQIMGTASRGLGVIARSYLQDGMEKCGDACARTINANGGLLRSLVGLVYLCGALLHPAPSFSTEYPL
eukprot:3886166-Amphidinium_carterae.1